MEFPSQPAPYQDEHSDTMKERRYVEDSRISQ